MKTRKMFLLLLLVAVFSVETVLGACVTITQDNTTYVVRPDECITISGNFTNVTIVGDWKSIGDNVNLDYGESYENNDVDIHVTCEDTPFYNITKVLGRGECWTNQTFGLEICASNETINMTEILSQINYTLLGSNINLQCPDVSGLVKNYTKCLNDVDARNVIIDKQKKELENLTASLEQLEQEKTNLSSQLTGCMVGSNLEANNSGNGYTESPDIYALLIVGAIIGGYFYLKKTGRLRQILNRGEEQ